MWTLRGWLTMRMGWVGVRVDALPTHRRAKSTQLIQCGGLVAGVPPAG